MSDLDTQADQPDSAVLRNWARIPVLVRAVVTGVFVMAIGVQSWPVIAILMPAPWSAGIMAVLLWLFWMYFSGHWAPKSTHAARRENFRDVKLSRTVWLWGVLLLAPIFVAIWNASLVVTFRLIEFPAELFAEEYRVFSEIPVWIAWIYLIMTSLVAGICEETGFRGYMQVPLENRFGPAVAIIVVTIVFVAVHLHQAWSGPILVQMFLASALLAYFAYATGSLIPGIIAHISLDVINFSYWWTDIAGRFEERPISETGVDVHFIIWVLILIVGTGIFVFGCRKVQAARKADRSV